MALTSASSAAGAAAGSSGAAAHGSDDIATLREKLRLLESDRRGYFDSSQRDLKANREEIQRLRAENKGLKATITAAKRGTGTVIEKELAQLDHGIYTTTLRLDNLRNEVIARREQLAKEQEKQKDVEIDCEPLLTEESYTTRKISLLENRLDKSLIKYNEAVSIKKTYEQIVKRLREERVGFDNQLAAIERTLQAKEHDYQELLKMSHEANHAKEVAKKELQEFKAQFDEERRAKDRELAERKAYVQSRVDQTQRLEKREKALRQKEQDEARARLDDESPMGGGRGGAGRAIAGRGGAGGSGGGAGGAGGGLDGQSQLSPEEQERLAEYETAFKAIKEATGVDDVNQLLQKFINQEDTRRSLQQLVKDSQTRIDQLNVEGAELTSKLEELRYSGSGQLGSRRIVEEFEAHLAEARAQTKTNGERYERLAKLLINVRAGIEHLVDKLVNVRSDTQIPKPVTDENCVEVLKGAEQKLVHLAEEVVPGDVAEDALVTAVGEMPINNRRVKISNGDEDIDDRDDQADVGDEQDDDAVLKRDQVKKISANSIQRETKKLKRRRRGEK